MALTSDTLLNDRYTIQRTLDDTAAFTVTYLGRDTQEQQDVVITEYFPRPLAERTSEGAIAPMEAEEERFQQGMKYFRKEAKVLREIAHPNLTPELEDFEERGTAYRASAHPTGASLATALEKNDGSVSERAALTVMKPVLGALHALHREGLLHGGLSPEAIYLTESRKVLLRDFRSAQLQLARKTGALDQVVLPGTSPAEQYDPDGRQGPWTDVYAAAATFYQAVAGQALPEAREPLAEDTISDHLRRAKGLSDGVRHVLERGLAPRPRGRMQSAQTFRELLEDPTKLLGDDEDASATAFAPPTEASASGEDKTKTEAEAEMWGPASIAAAAAEAAQQDKAEARTRKQKQDDRAAQRGRGGGEEKDDDGVLPVSNRVAMGGGAIVLLVLLAGAGLLFSGVLGGGASNAESSADATYTSLRAEADSLFEQAELGAARKRYEKAREIRPQGEGASHVTQRLRMIERVQRGVQEENYQRAMTRADSLKARAEALADQGEEQRANTLYAQAGASYLTALDHRPNDSLATMRAKAVDKALGGGGEGGDAASSEEQNPVCTICGRRHEEGFHARIASMYRDQAEDAFADENYSEARRKYKEVLVHQPNDEATAGRLEEINTRISAADREEQYRHYRQQGDALFEAGNLTAARREYQLALDVKPDDEAVVSRLDTIKQRLAQQKEQQEQYQYHRSRGDVFAENGELERAAESYEQALQYRPEDSYAKGQLDEVRQKIAAAEEAEKREARRRSQQTEDGIYKVVDVQPKVVGGMSAFIQEVSYPDRARRNGIEGRVYLRVTVGADGSVQDVKVTRGIGYGADEAAVRAARSVNFNPGRVDGEPVRAYRTLMVPFRIQK